jgi:hypothetical protein
MVNPGSFQGARKEFLFGEKPAYQAAVSGGYARDALAIIQRRFFKRFPIDLPLSDDPTPDALASVNDDTPDDEPEAPDEDLMMAPEEFTAAIEVFKQRQSLIQFRKEVSDIVCCLSPFHPTINSRLSVGLLINT